MSLNTGTPDDESIAVAINPATQAVYYITGPDSVTYPLTLAAVTDHDDLEIKSEVDRIHKTVLGIHFHGAPIHSADGRELLGLIHELRDSLPDVEPIEVIERRFKALTDSGSA